MSFTLVVGVGQEVAGDDGVGLAVLDELRRRGVPDSAELVTLAHTTDLVAVLERQVPTVVVDAVLASPPGAVLEVDPDDLGSEAPMPGSSHGMSVAQAIALHRALLPDAHAPVKIVAVAIERPERYRVGLSAEVAAAVPRAADRVLSLLEV